MTEKSGIKAEEGNIAKIFSPDFMFEIPRYQRPFIWNTQNFEELADDVATAKESGDDQYFLGSVLLQEIRPQTYEVVDGQQRLTALTLLLASVRDYTDLPKVKDVVKSRIYQEANEILDIQECWRIYPWSDLYKHFRDYVYTDGGTKKFISNFENKTIDYKDDDDPVYHIYEALKTFQEKLPNIPDVEEFVKYLLNKTFIVYIITSSQTSAFRLFNVMNSRGETLITSDLLKSENLGEIEDLRAREKFADDWRKIEESLGREELDNVINFIRTIKIQEKAKVNIYDEYQKIIFKQKLLQKGSDFFSYVYDISKIYEIKILDSTINSEEEENCNRYFSLVNLMNNYLPFSDWKPPLIHFFHTYKNEELIHDMLLKLEQKAFVEWAAGFSFMERITSLNRILKLIDSSPDDPQTVVDNILWYKEPAGKRGQVTRTINYAKKDEIISNLKVFDDPQFYSKYGGKLAKYALLRIEIERTDLSCERREYSDSVTVEHILPRNPPDNSEWLDLFDADQRMVWTNALGNLVLLSGKKNSQAQNYDFVKKKNVYFFSQKKKTNFMITRELDSIRLWNIDRLTSRHESFKNTLYEIYSK
jgi:uncharacterized protein with ParB-like and HNH nuclease domain